MGRTPQELLVWATRNTGKSVSVNDGNTIVTGVLCALADGNMSLKMANGCEIPFPEPGAEYIDTKVMSSVTRSSPMKRNGFAARTPTAPGAPDQLERVVEGLRQVEPHDSAARAVSIEGGSGSESSTQQQDEQDWHSLTQSGKGVKETCCGEVLDMGRDPIEFQIASKWYRVSYEWATRHHPGGFLVLKHMENQDATTAFFALHPVGTEARLAPHAIPAEEVAARKLLQQQRPSAEDLQLKNAFLDLHRRLVDDGMMKLDWSFYRRLLVWYAFLFVTAWVLLLKGAPFAASVCLGLFWQQLAFFGHDVGHNQHHFPHGDWIVTLLFGVSIGWWKASHNVHHLVTNEQEHDPDIQHLPVICLDERAFEGYYSTYLSRSFALGRAARFLVSYQHYLFYPIMAIARLNLYIQAILFLTTPHIARMRTRFRWRDTIGEGIAIGLFWIWFGTWLWYAASLYGKSEMFFCLLVSHVVAGVTHVQITLSHFAQPISAPTNGQGGNSRCWIRNAVETSLDVDCSPWMDWFHGGLQFQTLHHLFPRLPRHSLRYVNDVYLPPFLRQHGMVYNSLSFVDANIAVLSVLAATAQAARRYPLRCEKNPAVVAN